MFSQVRLLAELTYLSITAKLLMQDLNARQKQMSSLRSWTLISELTSDA